MYPEQVLLPSQSQSLAHLLSVSDSSVKCEAEVQPIFVVES